MFEKKRALEKQIEIEQDPFKRIDLQIALGWELTTVDLGSMHDLIEQIERALTDITYIRGQAFWLLLKALYDAKTDQYLEAINCVDSAYDIFSTLENVEGQIRSLRILSLVYALIGKSEESINICFKGLALIEDYQVQVFEENETPIEFTFYNNIAANYSGMGRAEECMTYQLKAYEYIKNEAKGTTHVLFYINLGQSYIDMGDYDLALESIMKGLHEARRLDLGSCYFHLSYLALGQLNHKMGDYEKAEKNLIDALLEKDAPKYGQAEVQTSLGRLYYDRQQYDLAIDAFQQAIRIAEEINTNEFQRDSHEWIAKCYELQNDFGQAITHYKHSLEINRKLAKVELNEQLEKYTANFKVEQAKKDAEIYKLKNVELKEKNDEIAQKALELEASYHNINTLSLIGKQITASLDIEKVLDTIYSSVMTLMDASIFGIGTYDHQKGVIDYKMFIEQSVRLPVMQVDIKDSKSMSVRCIKDREAIVDNNLAHSQRAKRIVISEEPSRNKDPQSLIYYPLILGDAVIGVITVQSYQPDAYTDVHLDAIKILASYIAIALNNSQQSEALQKAVKELEVFSKTDPLTELYNRRYISEKITEECERYKRSARKFSVIITDIDFFKNVNDAYGHDCGDFILKELSELLKLHLRKQDHLARWGGEEFLILLTETDVCSGAAMAERLRKIIMDTVFTYNGQSIQMTMTFGIAEYHEEPTIEETIKRADRALYHGKDTGRNKCVIGGIHNCLLPNVEEITGVLAVNR